MSEEIKVTQDPNLDIASIFNETKKTKTDTSKPDPTIVPAKTPLQLMQESKGKGLVIQNNQDDGPKRGGSMTEERVEAVQKTMNEMDELAEKARLVGITQKPTNDLELASLVGKLDSLDINELRRANEHGTEGSHIEGNNVATEDVIGEEVSASTHVGTAHTGSIDESGLFIPRSQVKAVNEQAKSVEKETASTQPEIISDSEKVAVTINKDAMDDGTKLVVEFTEEEREKLVASKQIELISVNSININTGKVTRPDEKFRNDYATNMRNVVGASTVMTFVASRFRATLKGLTFGQYMNLALAVDITDSEILNKKLSIIYNAIVDSSIGSFANYDDFLRNFAYKDVPLATYALYIATNPELLELGLVCGVETCKKNFSIAFTPRNLLVMDRLSPRFLEIMETTGKADGRVAMDYHNESTIITKKIVELPVCKVGVEFGLRSCYDMINVVLPFINNIEEIMTSKHPDDINHVHEIIALATNYISALYFMDENGDYTIREDNIESIVDFLYDIPMSDYEIISNIMTITDEDYMYGFGVPNVVCPACGNVTKLVDVDIDNEVFRQFQEQGSTKINKETLPRL